MATAPLIVDVYPANGSRGIVLSDQVRILFDQEMDETWINTGTFVLTGPDENFIFGPDFNPLDEPGVVEEDILRSPYYTGTVKGTISFKRVDIYGSEVEVYDYTGAGDSYRTMAIFTPDRPLAPGVEYRVLVAGDEASTDEFDTGVRSRSVFDTKNETVSGTGRLTFAGGFSGTVGKKYWIEITTGGNTGSAEYIWWEDADPLTTFPGISTTGRRLLEDGVWVVCDPDGTFTVGDTFSVVCLPPVVMENNYSWTFTTGSGSIAIPPSSYSASGIEAITAETSPTLQVLSIVPANRSTNLNPDEITEIVITFNHPLNSATITDAAIDIISEPVNGDTSGTIRYEGKIAKVLSVNGNVLTIQIT